IWINASLSARQRDRAAADIRAALIAKGEILVSNNSQALEDLVPDNAFLSVARLVATTVRDDQDVVYGVFMDQNRQPWVDAGPGNPEGGVNGAMALSDSAS